MDKKNYFIRIGTGIQPIIAKRIAVRVSSDLGFMRNGLAEVLFLRMVVTHLVQGFIVIFILEGLELNFNTVIEIFLS